VAGPEDLSQDRDPSDAPRASEAVFGVGQNIMGPDGNPRWKVNRINQVADENIIQIVGPDGSVNDIPEHDLIEMQLAASPEVLDERLAAAEELGEDAVEQSVEIDSSIEAEAKKENEKRIKAAEEAGELAVGGSLEREDDDGEGSAAAETAADPAEGVAEIELKAKLASLGVNNEKIDGVLRVLNGTDQEVQAEALRIMGLEDATIPKIIDRMGWSGTRLKLEKLHKDLGLPEDAGEPDSLADAAHRIILENIDNPTEAEEQLLELGFLDKERGSLRKILTTTNSELLQERLEELGLSPAQSNIISRITNRNMLNRAMIKALGYDPYQTTKILLAPQDILLEKEARSGGISEKALARAKELGHSTEFLIKAAETAPTDEVRAYLKGRGVELPGNPEPPTHAQRGEHKMGDDDWIYDPNKIPDNEVIYFANKIKEDPGWIRANLVRPGSISMPDWLRQSRLGEFASKTSDRLRQSRLGEFASKTSQRRVARPVVWVLAAPGRVLKNAIDWPYRRYIGQRLLARRLFDAEKARLGPGQNYGTFGHGADRRVEILHEIWQTDKTVKDARKDLGLIYRHTTRGDAREVARLDLGRRLAKLRRQMQKFNLAVEKLPTRESDRSRAIPPKHQRVISEHLAASLEHQGLGTLGVRAKAQQRNFEQLGDSLDRLTEQHEKLEKLEEDRHSILTRDEYQRLNDLKVRTPAQQYRIEELNRLHPDWKKSKKRRPRA